MNLSFLTSKFHIIPYRPVGQTPVGLTEENERYFPIKPRGMALLQFVCSFFEFPARGKSTEKEISVGLVKFRPPPEVVPNIRSDVTETEGP